MDKDTRLKLAVQKSGRLTDHSLDLLGRCGLKLSRGKDQLMGFGENLPLDVLFVRDDDIPDLVQEDVCDLGLVGLNVLEERRLEMARARRRRPLRDPASARLRPLPAVARGAGRHGWKDLASHCRTCASPPPIPPCWPTSSRSNDIKARDRHAVRCGGNRAAAGPRRPDLRSGVVGLDAAGQSPARSAHHPAEPGGADPHADEAAASSRKSWISRLLLRIDGVEQVKESKYIMLHAPRSALPRIRELLPGSESPTIIPLEGFPDKVAIHAVCRENVFWETLESLKAAGASALLVLPVEKMLN